MDTLTFIAAIVTAIAWPASAITIAVLFQKQIRALLARIRKGKVGPAEFEFEQEVKDLTEQVPQIVQPQVAAPDVSLATSHPRAAILDAWVKVESAAHRLAYHHHLPAPSAPRNAVTIIRALEKNGLLGNEDVALFNDLRMLRNQATHDVDFSPSPESAIQYVRLAQGLKERLDRAAGGGR